MSRMIQTMPPLARSVWPLIQAPSGPARKATAAAMSSGVPSRSSGFILAKRSISSCDLPLRNSSVAVGPGATALTVIERPRSLLGEDRRHRFDRGLGRGIDAVGLKLGADDAGREIDDPAAVAQALGGFAHRVESALEIDRDLLVEQRVVAVGDRRELHDAGIVDQHIDAAEGGFRRVEHAAHRVGIADIGLRGQRPAALAFDLAGQRLGRIWRRRNS